jgi:hypothetical protein
MNTKMHCKNCKTAPCCSKWDQWEGWVHIHLQQQFVKVSFPILPSAVFYALVHGITSRSQMFAEPASFICGGNLLKDGRVLSKSCGWRKTWYFIFHQGIGQQSGLKFRGSVNKHAYKQGIWWSIVKRLYSSEMARLWWGKVQKCR